MLKRALRLALVLLAGAAASSCVSAVNGQRFPALADRRAPIQRIAVVPLHVRPEQALSAAPLVARRLTEALVERGIEVVAPEDVARAMGGADASDLPALAAQLSRAFGADAVVVGEITRWVEREGAAAGAMRPAAVGLSIDLYGAPDGARLWQGEFDHTQQPLTQNVLLTPRYPGGGTRWLTAEELAEFGASELAAAVPLAP